VLATRTARWTALTVLTSLLLVVAFWFLLIGPRRAEAAEVAEQTTAIRDRNQALELQIAQLKSQFATLPQKKQELAAIQAQMPAELAMPTLIKSLDTLAGASSVTLAKVTPGEPQALGAAAGAAATGTGTAGAASGGASATGATPAAAASPVTAIPLAVSVEGGYFQTVSFLKRLQTEAPRLFLINDLTVTQGEGSEAETVTLSISAKVFGLATGATTGGSSTGGSGTGGNTSTGTGANSGAAS